mgnify:CR=1 FL=1
MARGISVWQGLLLESRACDRFLGRGCTAPVRADLYGYADCLSRVVAGWNLDRLSILFDLLEAHGCAESRFVWALQSQMSSPDDGMWTALYLSGFLTTDMTEEPEHGNRSVLCDCPITSLDRPCV